MFVFLSKLLPPFVYPLGLACLCLVLALILETRPGKRTGRVRRLAVILALLLLWLGGNRWVAGGLARSLEVQYLAPTPMPSADAIVLLGGGTETPDAPRPMVGLNAAGDRVLYAAELYREGKAGLLLVSGGLLDWNQASSRPSQDMAVLLEWMGVPPGIILQQDRSRNTYEDAYYCAEILHEHAAQRILLVTSAWHMPRAVRLFEAQGFTVIPAPTDFLTTDRSWSEEAPGDVRSFLLGLLPSAQNLATTTNMLKEYIGLVVYKIQGYY